MRRARSSGVGRPTQAKNHFGRAGNQAKPTSARTRAAGDSACLTPPSGSSGPAVALEQTAETFLTDHVFQAEAAGQ